MTEASALAAFALISIGVVGIVAILIEVLVGGD